MPYLLEERVFVFVEKLHDRGFAAHNRSFARKKNPLAPRVGWPRNGAKLAKFIFIHIQFCQSLIFTNVFIQIQQPSLRSRKIFIHI